MEEHPNIFVIKLVNYADRLEQHLNALAIDLVSDAETPRRLKRKLPQDLCI